MNLPKITIKYPNDFSIGEFITFYIIYPNSTKIYLGTINKSEVGTFFIDIKDNVNRTIFINLHISPTKFIFDLFGFYAMGDWPEVYTLEQLKITCQALEHYDEF